MDLKVGKMTSAHIGTIAKLEKECFSVPWSKESLESELTNGFARFYVANFGNDIAGYIGAHNILGEVYITNVAVFESFRRKGVALKLIETLIEEAEKENAGFVTLEVRKSNFSAISLYEKTGFKIVGERKDFYEKPREDAVLMTRYINKFGDEL